MTEPRSTRSLLSPAALAGIRAWVDANAPDGAFVHAPDDAAIMADEQQRP